MQVCPWLQQAVPGFVQSLGLCSGRLCSYGQFCLHGAHVKLTFLEDCYGEVITLPAR